MERNSFGCGFRVFRKKSVTVILSKVGVTLRVIGRLVYEDNYKGLKQWDSRLTSTYKRVYERLGNDKTRKIKK